MNVLCTRACANMRYQQPPSSERFYVVFTDILPIHTYIHTYIHIYIYIHIWLYIYTCMYTYGCVYMCICVYMYPYVFIYYVSLLQWIFSSTRIFRFIVIVSPSKPN